MYSVNTHCKRKSLCSTWKYCVSGARGECSRCFSCLFGKGVLHKIQPQDVLGVFSRWPEQMWKCSHMPSPQSPSLWATWITSTCVGRWGTFWSSLNSAYRAILCASVSLPRNESHCTLTWLRIVALMKYFFTHRVINLRRRMPQPRAQLGLCPQSQVRVQGLQLWTLQSLTVGARTQAWLLWVVSFSAANLPRFRRKG